MEEEKWKNKKIEKEKNCWNKDFTMDKRNGVSNESA